MSNVTPKVTIRVAEKSDVTGIRTVELSAWDESQSFTEEQLLSQLSIYPESVFVAEIEDNTHGKRIVGTVSVMLMDERDVPRCRTWHEITSDGYFNSHKQYGNVMFGANLGVSVEYQNLGIGDSLFIFAFSKMVEKGLKFGLLGSRLPGLSKFNQQRREQCLRPLTGEEYAQLKFIPPSIEKLNEERTKKGKGPLTTSEYQQYVKKRSGKLFDDELRFYVSQPFVSIQTVLPEYFPDPESENYGVLLRVDNPFYALKIGFITRFPFLGPFISKIGAKLLRKFG